MSARFLHKILLFSVVLICLFRFAEGADNFGVRGLKFYGTNLETACQMVEDADIGWYRGDVLWRSIVDEGGSFNWGSLDQQIESILGHGINIILTLRSVHEVFAPGSGEIDMGYDTFWKSAPPSPEHLESYKDFVRQAVERYDGDGVSDAPFVNETKNIKHWQIENEPGKKPDEGSVFWNGNAADYADLFLTAYNTIKEADSEAKVALSGFHNGAITYYVDGNSFLLEVLRIISERNGDFDIFDYHFYEDYKKFPKINNKIHSRLSTYSKFKDKPIWVTETNVSKGKMDPNYATEEYNRFVAKDIVKRFTIMLKAAVKKSFWFKFSDNDDAIWNTPMKPEDFIKFRGLTKNDLTSKPVYYTYKLLIEKVEGKEKVKKVPAGPRTWVFKFGIKDAAIYVMWYDDLLGGSKEVKVSLPWENVLITYVITEAGVTEPVTEIKSTQDGALQITLEDSPIFVEKYSENGLATPSY